jgi:hypothetical protein
MKLIAAVLIASLVPAAAMAQSSLSPNNSSGSGISPSVQAPTDMGASAANGDVRGVPSRGRIGTTGSALAPEPMLNPPAPMMVRGQPIPGDQHFRNASPASPAEGIEKER